MSSSDATVAAAQEALKVADLVLENEGLKADVDELIELRQKEERALAFAEAEVAHLEEDYEEQTEEVTLLQQEVGEQQEDIDGLHADVDELTELKEAHEEALEGAQDDFDELTTVYLAKVEDLQMAEEDVQELKDTLASTETALAKAVARIAILEGENQRLKAEAATAVVGIKEAGIKELGKAKVADKENGGAQSPAPRKSEAKKGLQSPFTPSRLAIPGC